MGNLSLAKGEPSLASNDGAAIRKGCVAILRALHSSPESLHWPWVLYLLGQHIHRAAAQLTSAVHSEEFHRALRSLVVLPKGVVSDSHFQAILRHSLVPYLLEAIFFEAHPGSFVATLSHLLGAQRDAALPEDLRPGTPEARMNCVECGLFPATWKKLLACVVQHEQQLYAPADSSSCFDVPAPLLLLKHGSPYYASEECLPFGIFLFHCAVRRETIAATTVRILSVLYDYLAPCRADALLRCAGTTLNILGPNGEEVVHATVLYVGKMAALLHENVLHHLRNPKAIPMCQQSLACFQFFSHAFPDSTKVLELLQISLTPYANVIEEDGHVSHGAFDHELHLSLLVLLMHLRGRQLTPEQWGRALHSLVAILTTFRAHLLMDFNPADPPDSPVEVCPTFRPPVDGFHNVLPATVQANPAIAANPKAAMWTLIITAGLQCLHALVRQPGADIGPDHPLLLCRLLAYLLVNIRPEFTPLLQPCIAQLAERWAITEVFALFVHAVLDEILAALTLGSLFRHCYYRSVDGDELLATLQHLMTDLGLQALPLQPSPSLPPLPGLQLPCPQLSFASWILHAREMAPFLAAPIQHKIWFIELTSPGAAPRDLTYEKPLPCPLLPPAQRPPRGPLFSPSRTSTAESLPEHAAGVNAANGTTTAHSMPEGITSCSSTPYECLKYSFGPSTVATSTMTSLPTYDFGPAPTQEDETPLGRPAFSFQGHSTTPALHGDGPGPRSASFPGLAPAAPRPPPPPPTPPPPLDAAEVLGPMACVSLQWAPQHFCHVVDLYHVAPCGRCDIVVPDCWVAGPRPEYHAALQRASQVLTMVTREMVARLQAIMGLECGGSHVVALCTPFFQRHSGSHLMCYLHREALCGMMKGETRSKFAEDLLQLEIVQLRAELHNLRRKVRQAEGLEGFVCVEPPAPLGLPRAAASAVR